MKQIKKHTNKCKIFHNEIFVSSSLWLLLYRTSQYRFIAHVDVVLLKTFDFYISYLFLYLNLILYCHTLHTYLFEKIYVTSTFLFSFFLFSSMNFIRNFIGKFLPFAVPPSLWIYFSTMMCLLFPKLQFLPSIDLCPMIVYRMFL